MAAVTLTATNTMKSVVPVFILLAMFVASAVWTHQADATLYGSSVSGELFTLDVATGAGTLIGSLPPGPGPTEPPPGPTEIEFDNTRRLAWLQYQDGVFFIQQFDLNSGTGIGPPIFDEGAYTGLEFVGGTLYGTVITQSGGPSQLRILDPTTGASTLVGATGVGPISGLAYDESTGVMYAIAGGPGPANLFTVSLLTGAVTEIGSTGIQAGSLEFGDDGNLYAGGTGADGGNLFLIDPATGASSLVGPTGFSNVTGLTLVLAPQPPTPIPAPNTLLLMFGAYIVGLGAMAVVRRQRKARPACYPF